MHQEILRVVLGFRCRGLNDVMEYEDISCNWSSTIANMKLTFLADKDECLAEAILKPIRILAKVERKG